MKRLIIFIIILFYCCNQKSDEIEKMEIISYYNFPKNHIVYSFVDNNHIAKTSFNSEPEFDSKINYFKSEIGKGLFDSIIEITKNAKNEDFKFKIDKNLLYCGPIFRFKVKYKNGKEFDTFFLYINKENLKFKPFKNLYLNLINDSIKEKIKLNKNNQIDIYRKKFQKYSKKQDSILFSK